MRQLTSELEGIGPESLRKCTILFTSSTVPLHFLPNAWRRNNKVRFVKNRAPKEVVSKSHQFPPIKRRLEEGEPVVDI